MSEYWLIHWRYLIKHVANVQHKILQKQDNVLSSENAKLRQAYESKMKAHADLSQIIENGALPAALHKAEKKLDRAGQSYDQALASSLLLPFGSVDRH